MRLIDSKPDSRFTLLQIGESGAGKTHRSLTATQFGPIFVLDLDGKLEGYGLKLSAEEKAKIHYACPKTAEEVFEELKKLKELKIATVVLDTWSAWHAMAIESHIRLNKSNRVKTKSVLGDLEQLAQPDWGAIKKLNEMFLNMLLALPYNIIVNTHVGSKTDEYGNSIMTVGTTGSFGETMPRWFRETHQIYIDSTGKRQVKAAQANKMAANSMLPIELFDATGNLKNQSLAVLEPIAKKVAP